MTVGQIILQQIRALDRRAMMAWGAKDIVLTNNGVMFKTSGLVRWKGKVIIEYDAGADLYNVTFGRLRKLDFIVDKKLNGVYAEDMVEIIDAQVG